MQSDLSVHPRPSGPPGPPGPPSFLFVRRRSPEQHASALEWAWTALDEFKGRLEPDSLYRVGLDVPGIIQVLENDECVMWASDYLANNATRTNCSTELSMLLDGQVQHLAEMQRKIAHIRDSHERRKRKREDTDARRNVITID